MRLKVVEYRRSIRDRSCERVLLDSVFLAEGKPEGFALCFFRGVGRFNCGMGKNHSAR